MNTDLRDELIAMIEADLATRQRLFDTGESHPVEDLYHPDLAAVHTRNNTRLREILDVHGWPGHMLVGEEGALAVWQIAMHAVLDPDLRERCAVVLGHAVAVGDAPGWQLARLTDAVHMQNGEPQVYGCIMIVGPEGTLIPWTIAYSEKVDALRASVGLGPLAEQLSRSQAGLNDGDWL
jgi:hypothetical protein